jgi:hypothetical protein
MLIMAETTAEKKTAAEKKATKAYVPTRSAETAAGSLREGELVYLHDSDAVKALVDGGYLMSQKDYLEQTDPVVLTEMERRGVSARESGSGPAE